MKCLLIATLTLVMSSSVFAARLPTYNEAKKFDEIIMKGKSLRPIIDLIAQGEINPLYRYDVKLASEIGATPGKSILASILLNRFNLDAPLGSEAENLQLLELLIDAGLDLNQPQQVRRYNDETLMTLATAECANKAFDLMLAKGANPNLENRYWLNALRRSYQYEAGSVNDLKCSSIVMRNLDEVNSINIVTAYVLFTGEVPSNTNYFLTGSIYKEWTNLDIQEKLEQKFGIRSSATPKKGDYSKEWIELFKERMGRPTIKADEPGPYEYIHWWPNYTEEEKAFACYYSSFDEFYHVLKFIGYTDEQIINKPLTNVFLGAVFGDFAVKVLVPYCDSIRP